VLGPLGRVGAQDIGPPPRDADRVGTVDDDLVQAVRRYLISHENTELAAFRIGHARPWEALPVGKYRRAELLALGHGGRMDVDMDALLDGPFFWDGVDPDPVLWGRSAQDGTARFVAM